MPNGLRILHVPDQHADSVFVAITGRVGRRAEQGNEVGAAHFLEHLFFDGTPKHPTSQELAKFLEFYGGNSNGTTSSEVVEYWSKVLSKDARVAFEYIADIFFNSFLRDEDIAKERKVIAQEAAMRKDDPGSLMQRFWSSTIYPGQTIGQTIFDEELNLENMNRQILDAYMGRNYVAENFILTVAGDITESEVTTLAGEYFAQMRSGTATIFPQAKMVEGRIMKIQNKDFAQSKLRITFPGFAANTPQEVPADLLSVILGEGMSSRLFHTIREELHLAYSVGASHGNFSDGGYFRIGTATSEDKLQQAADAIFGQIRNLLDHGIADEEVHKAKNCVWADLVFGFERAIGYAEWLAGQWLMLDRIMTIEEAQAELEKTTSDDIMKVARQIFSEEPKVTILTKSLSNFEINY